MKLTDFEEIKETFREIKQELDQRYEVFEPLKGVHDEDGIIAQVTEYISQEYRDGTLTKLAGKLYLNPSYLSQLIKLKTGKNFVDLLFDTRMNKACQLLKSQDVKIYNISEMVGYTNPNNFTRAFKARYGQSPREYQTAYKGRMQ